MQVACLRCLPARKPLRRFSTLRRFPPFLPCRKPVRSISDTHPVDIGHRSGPNRTPFRSHRKTVRHQPGRLSDFNRNTVRFESERCPTSNRIGVRFASEYASGKALHLILDNYGTHGHPKVREWLARHPRFVLHFIPTSSSWLNLVERWFAELTQKSVRRGSFHSVDDLEQAIAAFLDAWNANPTPFVWTASVEKILEKVERCRRRLDQIEPGCAALKRPRPTPPQSG